MDQNYVGSRVITAKTTGAAILLLSLAAPFTAQAALAPAGQLYKLNVTTSFEAPFIDCWSFGSNGRFIYSSRLKYFPYQLTGLNTNAGQYQAIWQGHVSIAFAGTANGTTITGNAVDASDRTYSITGTAVSSCAGISAGGTAGFVTH